jgi:serine/threonine protein kinase
MYNNILSKFVPYNDNPIGTGGFAEIYEGYSAQLGIKVAIKIFKKEYHNNTNYLEQFTNEARKIAGINHPNIIRIYENQLDEFYYVMSLLDSTLSEKLTTRGGMLSEGKTIRLAIDITTALCELANQTNFGRPDNVIHRDLKPSNIMFDFSGNAVLADFGISVFEKETPEEVAGTAQYMSPEQFEKGKKLDGRSDMYSLGVILFQISTGHLPFSAKSFDEYKNLHQNEKPKDPRDLFLGINPEIADIILKLLEKNPSDRFASAHVLLKKLNLLRDNYKNRRINKFLGHIRDDEPVKAKKISETYLRDDDPTDRYFQDELAKLTFSSMLYDSKSELVSLNLENAKRKLKKAEMTRENDSDKEYLSLKQNVQIVDNCYKELLLNIEKADIGGAMVNFEDIDKIISSYGDKGSFEKIEYYRELLSSLEKAQAKYRDENYSSALVEYSNAKKIDQNNLSYINEIIETIERKIETFSSELQDFENFGEQFNQNNEIIALQTELSKAKESEALFNLENRKKLETIYHKLLMAQGLEYNISHKYEKALDSFRRAREYSAKENAKKNILLLEILSHEEKKQFPSAIRNCEILIESIEGNDQEGPDGNTDIAPQYNLEFLEQKLVELEKKLNLQNEFETIDINIKLKKANEATASLDALENKIKERSHDATTIDLSQFESQILDYRNRITKGEISGSVPLPPSTIVNTSEPGKQSPKKPSKVGAIIKTFSLVLFLGAISIFAGPKLISLILRPSTPAPENMLSTFSSIPTNSELYIDDSLRVIKDNVFQDSLFEGTHSIQIKNPRFSDTTFVAQISKDSSNNFSLSKWCPATAKATLTIEPKPDVVRANGRAIASSSNLYSFISSPGIKRVQIEKNGYETKSLSLQLDKSTPLTRNIILKKLTPGKLAITVYPFATIILDGVKLASNAKKTNKPNIVAGSHQLKLLHNFYGVYETKIQINSGQENLFAFNLDDECGELFVAIQDENNDRTFANIFVNNELAAELKDLLKVKKLPGTYEIIIEKDGYDQKASMQSVTVKKGETTRIDIRLVKN